MRQRRRAGADAGAVVGAPQPAPGERHGEEGRGEVEGQKEAARPQPRPRRDVLLSYSVPVADPSNSWVPPIGLVTVTRGT